MPKTSSPKRGRRASGRGGKSSYSDQLAGEVREAHSSIRNLASKIERENMTKGIPFAGSKTAAALAKAFEEPVEYNQVDLAEELQNDTGDCINKLAFYDVNMSATPENTLFRTMQFVSTGADHDGIRIEGDIDLDERAALMASVGASMVICKILHGVKSKSYYDNSGLEKKLIYLEDIIEHIHDTYGDVITLDKSSSDAFERMTRDQRKNHERKLLKDIFNEIMANVAAGTVGVNNIDGANHDVSHFFYDEKLSAMAKVTAGSVGKSWQTDPANAGGRLPAALNPSARTHAVNDAHIYHKLMVDTMNVIKGSPRIQISSNLKIFNTLTAEAAVYIGGTAAANDKYPIQKKAMDVAVVILSLVAMHVLTYANTAALDFYIKLARKGGYTVGPGGAKTITFAAGNNNVLTHSVFAPGLLAALKMYGISESAFDDEMAFQINTNADVKALFVAAHTAYDSNGANLVGAKTFKSEVDTVPSWLVPKEKQLEYEQEFARTKGVRKALPAGMLLTAPNATVAGIAGNIATEAVRASNKNLAKHIRNVTGFGRRRRRRSSAFGRRKRSSKRKASFGRRKKSNKAKKTSFGRRRRRASVVRK